MESDEGTTVDTPKRIEELEAQLEQLEEQVINSKALAESTIDNCIKLTWELESEKDKLSTKQWKAGIDRRKLEEAIAIRLQDDSAHKSMVAEAEAKTRRIKSLRKHKDATPPDLVGEMEALEKLKEEIRQFKAEKTADLREKYDREILGLSSEIRVSKREIERMEKTISDGIAEWGKLKRKNTDLLMRAFILGEEKRKIEDEVVRRFCGVVSDCISQALAVSYPAISAAPHMFVNAYNNALAVAIATDYSFPLADGVKEYLADPAKFAVVADLESDGEYDSDYGFPLYDPSLV